MFSLTQNDIDGINLLFQNYGTAWSARDVDGCVALYAEDGDAVAIDGSVLRGPEELRQYYDRELSGKYQQASVTNFAIDPPRALGSAVALLNASWRLEGNVGATTGHNSIPVHGTFVVRKRGAEWIFVAVRLAVPLSTDSVTTERTSAPA